MRSVLVLLSSMFVGVSATAQNWKMDLEVPEAKFQEVFNKRNAEGYMPAALTARAVGADTRFQVTWQRSTGTWEMRHGDDAASLTAAATAYVGTGYRPVFIESYGAAAVDERYASLWVLEPGVAWQALGDLTPAQLQTQQATFAGLGYTLHWISGNGSGTNRRFAAVWLQSGLGGQIGYDMDQAGFQSMLASNPALRLASLSTYGANDSKFAAVMLNTGTTPRVADDLDQYGIDLDAFQQAQLGYRTTLVDARDVGGEPRFTSAQLFVSTNQVWRMTGQAVPGMGGFDTAMQSYMQTNNLAQGSLAVVKDGRLQLAKGYTWAPLTYPDASETTTYRIASVSKPLTSIAIMRLREQGLLNLNQSVTNILGLPQWIDQNGFPATITVRDLLHHRGGFDNSPDPMFNDSAISTAQAGGALPITTQHIISWMQTQQLVRSPGSAYEYCNFGYSLLGRVIEAVTGKNYAEYMQDEIFSPLGASTMVIGKSLFDERMPREALNGDLNQMLLSSMMGPTSPALVPIQYGRWNIGNLDSHGGWVASAIDIARVISALGGPDSPINAQSINVMQQPHPNETATNNFYVKGWWSTIDGANIRYNHNGSLWTGLSNQGCRAFLARRTDGVIWMACFGGLANPSIDSSLAAVADTAPWSPVDLFSDYAQASTFGEGCEGPDGQLRVRPLGDNLPTLSSHYRVQVEHLGTAPWNLPVMVLSIAPLPAPVPLDGLGFTGCMLNVNLDVNQPMANVGGTAVYDLVVPPNSNVLGTSVFMQAAVLEPGINPAGFALSHGLESVVGL